MEKIFVLPFDHRSSFLKKMFDIENRSLTPQERAMVIDFKNVIYQGFRKSVDLGSVPKEFAALMVDEEFGDEILRDAKERGYHVCVPTEKSGQDEFDFEYGDSFGEHIKRYSPDVVKALVRYNPAGDEHMNARQRERLKQLSEYCKQNQYHFMIEPLIPATPDQLEAVEHSQADYDQELRPRLTVTMIEEMQQSGVEPDIWKIEGFENPEDYTKAVNQIRAGGRDAAIAIVLGRGAEDEQVETWLTAGAGVEGVSGFAVGRSIFWQALTDYKHHVKTADEAATEIARKYTHFYNVFTRG